MHFLDNGSLRYVLLFIFAILQEYLKNVSFEIIVA